MSCAGSDHPVWELQHRRVRLNRRSGRMFPRSEYFSRAHWAPTAGRGWRVRGRPARLGRRQGRGSRPRASGDVPNGEWNVNARTDQDHELITHRGLEVRLIRRRKVLRTG